MKLQFCITLFVFCIKCNATEFYPHKLSIEFEEIKNAIFTSNKTEVNKQDAKSPADSQCERELRAVGVGLRNFDLWAIKSKLMCFELSNLSKFEFLKTFLNS